MSGRLQFDTETSRIIESLYLTPDVVAQQRQVLTALALREGERVLDIGSGPGLLAHDMAASVGRDGRVCGIDISEDMLAMSRKRWRRSTLDRIPEGRHNQPTLPG